MKRKEKKSAADDKNKNEPPTLTLLAAAQHACPKPIAPASRDLGDHDDRVGRPEAGLALKGGGGGKERTKMSADQTHTHAAPLLPPLPPPPSLPPLLTL